MESARSMSVLRVINLPNFLAPVAAYPFPLVAVIIMAPMGLDPARLADGTQSLQALEAVHWLGRARRTQLAQPEKLPFMGHALMEKRHAVS